MRAFARGLALGSGSAATQVTAMNAATIMAIDVVLFMVLIRRTTEVTGRHHGEKRAQLSDVVEGVNVIPPVDCRSGSPICSSWLPPVDDLAAERLDDQMQLGDDATRHRSDTRRYRTSQPSGGVFLGFLQ